MQSLISFKLFLVLAIVVVVSACKKYDDGPLFSLRSPEQRLQNRWYLIGRTNDVPEDSIYEDYTHIIGDVWMFDAETVQIEKRLGGISRIKYRLVDEDKKIRIDFPSWYYGEVIMEFEIHRLTGKDLKLVSLTEPQFTLVFSHKKL